VEKHCVYRREIDFEGEAIAFYQKEADFYSREASSNRGAIGSNRGARRIAARKSDSTDG